VIGASTASGIVWLDDNPLENSEWRVTGVNTVEILGEACEVLKDGNSHFLSVEIDSCIDGG
ncbi:MAG: hypothetical protein AAFQ82_17590, partial [Myxococcota bacterium]